MRTLIVFTHSPFSRRTRLALAHKGLEYVARDGREDPTALTDAQARATIKTTPILIDGDRALADSTAITRWLDAEHPQAPRIWPEGREAFRALDVASLVDVALNNIVDVGTRYHVLRDHSAFAAVKDEMLGRTQRALDALAERARAAGASTFAPSGWSAAEMWLYTAVAWVESLPKRVGVSPQARQIVELGGWSLPDDLRRWADRHRARPDIQAL
jgi:glutathione S-transferase